MFCNVKIAKSLATFFFSPEIFGIRMNYNLRTFAFITLLFYGDIGVEKKDIKWHI